MVAPDNIKALLEFAASRVLQLTDPRFFSNDQPLGPLDVSTAPVISIQKTGGTTEHQQQGGNYLHYYFVVPSLEIKYSIYVIRASPDPVVNRAALARAIMWFIPHYGQTFSRDEPAT